MARIGREGRGEEFALAQNQQIWSTEVLPLPVAGASRIASALIDRALPWKNKCLTQGHGCSRANADGSRHGFAIRQGTRVPIDHRSITPVCARDTPLLLEAHTLLK
jgi:hypothetical protein